MKQDDDHFGMFGPDDHPDGAGRTGGSGDDIHSEVDVDELRAALRDTSRQADPQPALTPAVTRAQARAALRERREADKRRTRRKRRSALIALLVLALISGGVVVGFLIWRGSDDPVVRDYAGDGDHEVVVRIRSGDGLPTIADTLADAGVVASAVAFTDSAANDADVAALRPGYYKVRQHSSAKAAADQIVNEDNRVGRARLIPGRQLADVSARTKDGATSVPGYLTTIAEAACVPLNGKTDCASLAELQEVARSTPATELGVVEWALADVAAAPQPDKRLEGLILPGDYDVPPGADAATLLKTVITQSTTQWNSSNIIAESEQQGVTPYQAMVIASIVEREGLAPDMPQVARVIYNRLQKKMKLQMDSSVNYAMNRAQIATSNADRKNPDPYNTYRHAGLPPTPISSPGKDALDATFEPVPGTWLYFVKVDLQGNSCFSVTDAEHEACVDKARANGVFDG